MTRQQIISSVLTAVITALVILLLWLIHIHIQMTPEEESFPYDEDGIMMSYGYEDFGGGEGSNDVEGDPMPAKAETAPTAQEAASPMTQEDASPVSVPAVDLKKQRQEELEAKKKAAAEAAAKQAAIDRANKLGNALGKGSGSTGVGTGKGSGTGTGSGNGMNGNPAGHGTSGGHGWSLTGRSLVGSLGKPYQAPNTSGKVVVNIRVNQAGQVVAASKGTGTTVSDAKMIADCIAKAKAVHFSKGQDATESVGTITYNFALTQ